MYPTADNPESRADKFAVLDIQFEAGQTASDIIPLNGWVPIGVATPGDIGGATEVVFTADAGDENFRAVYDSEGNFVSVPVVADAYVKLLPPNYPGFVNVKLALNPTQTTRVKLSLIVRKVND